MLMKRWIAAGFVALMLGAWAPAPQEQRVADRIQLLSRVFSRISELDANISDRRIRPADATELEELYLRVREQSRRAQEGRQILQAIERELAALEPLVPEVGETARPVDDMTAAGLMQVRGMDELLAAFTGFEAALRSRDEARIEAIAERMTASANLGLESQELQLRLLAHAEPEDLPTRYILLSHAEMTLATAVAMKGATGQLSLSETATRLSEVSDALRRHRADMRESNADQRGRAARLGEPDQDYLLKTADIVDDVVREFDEAALLVDRLALIAGTSDPRTASDALREEVRGVIAMEARLAAMDVSMMELQAAHLSTTAAP